MNMADAREVGSLGVRVAMMVAVLRRCWASILVHRSQWDRRIGLVTMAGVGGETAVRIEVKTSEVAGVKTTDVQVGRQEMMGH